MKSIKVNFIYNSLYQVLVLIIPLITTPYISRILGPENTGIYSYTQSVAYYFIMIAMLGINNYGNRTCAAYRDNREVLSYKFWSIYIFQLIMSICTIILYLSYIYFIDIENKIIALIQSLYVISVAFDINWFFFGIEEFKLTTIRNSLVKILTVILILLFVKNKEDLWIYTIIMSAGTLISQLVIWTFLNRYVDLRKIAIKDIIQHIKPNLILFIPVLAVSLYKVMDKIMIGILSDMIQGGYYESSEKIVNLPIVLITSLGTVMLPRMSNLAAKKEIAKSKEYIENSMIFVLFFSIAFTFGLIGIAPVFVPIFFGIEFTECSKLICCLSPIIICISWANVIRTQYLIPNARDKEYIQSVILGAAINLLINLSLIPKFGSIGAVVGTVVAEVCVSISQTLSIKDELPFKKYIFYVIILIPVGVMMAIIIRLMSRLPVQPILLVLLQIGFGAAFYSYISINLIFKYNKRVKKIILNNVRIKYLKNKKTLNEI